MITSHTPDTLRAFTRRVADAFNEGKIRAPVHLSGGNEEQLIKIFQTIAPDDWLCGSWRQHYQCLLKGVPDEELFEAILAKRSITLCFPEYRIVSSGIVGGILPIALGLAWAIKRAGGTNRVHAFMGDMTQATGIAIEVYSYAGAHDLPLRFVVEHNGKSVCTPHEAVWPDEWTEPETTEYDYVLPWPHSGAGTRVQF